MHIAILVNFLAATLNWQQVLCEAKKYILNNLYEKLKNKVSLK